ncbi:MAG: hypothetical protein CFH06_00937 [Alphaproteobacteria bacterium MarineAlpha3_Bin5]|nr:hypothetical protein [Magnetovibrio sp.]PPR78135.1 MAG: hypothetical protein CFH06_00937 [Alphaproteobacteria bacterium MarineAlpha3_Bin5]
MKHLIFDKNKTEPFELSRTGIDEFLRCSRSFVLKRKYGVKPPGMPPLTLAIATDHLLNNEFDRIRCEGSSDHWIFRKFGLEVVPYQHDELDVWRSNFKGIRFFHEPTNMVIYGTIDDIWRNINSGELYLVDYKSTSKKEDLDIETG